MKMKDTIKDIKTIEQYNDIVGAVYKSLNDLKELMGTKNFKSAYKYDQKYDGENNLHGEFASFKIWLRDGLENKACSFNQNPLY